MCFYNHCAVVAGAAAAAGATTTASGRIPISVISGQSNVTTNMGRPFNISPMQGWEFAHRFF